MGINSKNNSGIILIVVLWSLVILSILAIGLGRSAGTELALTEYVMGKLRSKHVAMAGIFYAMDKIDKDNKDAGSQTFDTQFQCGFSLEDNESPESLFKNIAVGAGDFSIGYPGDGGEGRYGFSDEESKININALNVNNYEILFHLILALGYEEDVAQTVASSVVDWMDPDGNVFNDPHGAEEDYYSGLPHAGRCKNLPFDSAEEFMLVRGMDKDMFRQLEKFVTVFPKSGRFLLNVDTASLEVLLAFTRSLTGAKSNTEPADADSLVEKILSQRAGIDGLDGTEDDKTIEGQDLALNPKESVLYLLLEQNRTRVSRHIRLQIDGVDASSSASTHIEAVVFRDAMSLVYWRRR